MKIGLLKKSNSYLPEAYAYKKYLEKYGHSVSIFSNPKYIYDFDNIVLFMGFYPFKIKKKDIKIIHEYNSLSLQPYSFIKNNIKTLFNQKPNKRIFLNSFVKYFFNFNDNVEYIHRDMGVDENFFKIRRDKSKIEYDIVYSGSIADRKGIINCFINLANMGFKLAIIGNTNNDTYNLLKKIPNINLLGALDLDEICKIYSISYSGLNFTPDIFPYNFQTSTKTLEYSASGLNVISNNYFWINSFEKSRSAKFFYLEYLKNKDQILNYNFINANVEDKEWNTILDETNFKKFIED